MEKRKRVRSASGATVQSLKATDVGPRGRPAAGARGLSGLSGGPTAVLKLSSYLGDYAFEGHGGAGYPLICTL